MRGSVERSFFSTKAMATQDVLSGFGPHSPQLFKLQGSTMSNNPYQCDISVAQYTIGQTYSPELLEEVRAKADGAQVRVTGPKFASDRRLVLRRISLHTNADKVIVSIQCG
jgi:hypothetical protein